MLRFERVVALPDSKISDFPQPNQYLHGWIAGYGLRVILSNPRFCKAGLAGLVRRAERDFSLVQFSGPVGAVE